MAPRSRISLRVAILGVIGVCLAGCSGLSTANLPWHKVPLDASAGFYESTHLAYRLDASKLAQPVDAVRIEGQRVSFEQFASSPLSDQSTGTLSIAYPHPGGRPGWAQARFTLDSAPAKSAATNWNPLRKKPSGAQAAMAVITREPEIHEVWVLDIPSAESDQYFKLLAAQSFYNTERPGNQAAQLTVTINGSQVSKPWDRIAELDALVQRVRGQGQLVAYARPAAAAGLPENSITSVQAYGDLVARTGSPDAAASQRVAANPFSMRQPPQGQGVAAQTPAAVR